MWSVSSVLISLATLDYSLLWKQMYRIKVLIPKSFILEWLSYMFVSYLFMSQWCYCLICCLFVSLMGLCHWTAIEIRKEPAKLLFLRKSCLTCSCASCALSYVLLCLACFVRCVLLRPTCLAPYVPYVPYVPLTLRALAQYEPYMSRALE